MCGGGHSGLSNTCSVTVLLQVLEEKAGADVESVLEQARLCEAVLGEEKKQHAGTRNEVARLNQELDMSREDLIKERTKHREDVDVST